MARKAGILLHISSLPSAHGIGDLGPAAYDFAEFLADAGFSYWQILPLNPVQKTAGYSPYSSISAFAGNKLFINLDLLAEQGLLSKQELKPPKFPAEKVEYEKAEKYKNGLLKKVHKNYASGDFKEIGKDLKKFTKEHDYWLQDYALFVALKEKFKGKSWNKWPEEYRLRDSKTIKKAAKVLEAEIVEEIFLQYLFYRQWKQLQKFCETRGISFFGDLPIYVGYDSADVWANRDIFDLDKEGNPNEVAGVPPDYFSETGQLWGMPVFRWDVLKKQDYDWWMQRIQHNFSLFGLLRLDHFRGFCDYWSVPAHHETAKDGKWKRGPGADFFRKLQKKFTKLPLVAEDLGEIDQPVKDLMAQFDLPGMRVLQFGFWNDMPQSDHAPHNHTRNSLVYTGTHDNNTILGWYNTAPAEEIKNMRAYAGRRVTAQNVVSFFIKSCLSSVAETAVVPMQDFLGLGEEAIMNKPSTGEGNWGWRMKANAIIPGLAKKLHNQLKVYGRV